MPHGGPGLFETVVTQRVEWGACYVELRLEEPVLAGVAQPGQFLHVLCGDSPGEGLYRYLRRPLSLFWIEPDKVAVLFRVQGEGTRWLAERRPGDRVNVLGPLGRGFPLPAPGSAGELGGLEQWKGLRHLEHALLVGGGIGIPPLLPVADRLAKAGVKVSALLGGRSAADVLAIEEFRACGAVVEVATDDGSLGRVGLVTALLEEALSSLSSHGRAVGERAAVYACGPAPMLKAVQALAAQHLVPAYLSLEQRMACGAGACLGCPVKTVASDSGAEDVSASYALLEKARAGESGVVFKRVCHEGPVFPAWEVIL